MTLSERLRLSFCQRNALFVLAVLGLLTAAVFWPVLHQGFIGFDDPEYLTENPNLNRSLSWTSIFWALKTGYFCSWHPVTWISYLLDHQFFGLDPAGYHFTNLVFHVLNAVLLLAFLKNATGSLWRSAFVAAVFAWHPLRVESVAWVSERKDVLSTFFFLLTLLAYVRYVAAKTEAEDSTSSIPHCTAAPTWSTHYAVCYAVGLVLFALGLMSKPMVVTLPCVLLLLDYWPLERFQLSNFKTEIPKIIKLTNEKVPFFALAFIASIVTFLVQKTGGAVSSLSGTPITLRLENAVVSYARYILKTFWPTNLSIFYPYPSHWELGLVVGSVTLILAGSVLVAVFASRYKFLVLGWCWFMGTLVPAIGLVQVGSQSMADRYSYIPAIGLSIIVAWSVGEWCKRTRRAATVTAAATGVVAVLLCCTLHQLQFWADGVTLFQHALDVTQGNYVAYNYLGKAYGDSGDVTKALKLCAESVRLAPWYSDGQYNLGTLLLDQRRVDESIDHLRLAISYEPGSARICNNLGKALGLKGMHEESISALEKAVALKPDWPDAHYNLATELLRCSRPSEATAEFTESLRLQPENPATHMNLGVAFIQLGKSDEAVTHFAEAVRLAPNNAEARFNLGLALLEQKKPAEAVEQFTQELRLKPAEAKAHYRLAVALVQLDQKEQAVSHYQETLRLAPDFSQAAQELALLKGSTPIQ